MQHHHIWETRITSVLMEIEYDVRLVIPFYVRLALSFQFYIHKAFEADDALVHDDT